jgi:hypothetical protein
MTAKVLKRVVVFVLVAGLAAASSLVIYAHQGGSDWTLGKDLTWSPDTWNHSIYWDTPSSSFVSACTNLSWTQASGNAVRSSGHRYTHDVADQEEGYPHRLSATNWYNTNFWNPRFDRDEIPYTSTYVEAEVTSENANFPPNFTDFLRLFQLAALQFRRWLSDLYRSTL